MMNHSHSDTGESVDDFFQRIENLAGKIIQQLQNEVTQLGFNQEEVCLKSANQAIFHLEKDPSSGENSLVGIWLDERQNKLGSLLFHAQGNFFVEYDVVKPHPSKKAWFVEAVNAWGSGDQIKSEARLIPMP